MPGPWNYPYGDMGNIPYSPFSGARLTKMGTSVGKDEFFYTGVDAEIQFKTLDSAAAAGYAYAWDGSGHPLLAGTEIAESSAEYNKVTVNGSGAFTGTAENATESGLVGTRQRTITDESLGSDAQCLERAAAELSFWQARSIAGTLVARPHFTLRLYDVVSVAAPPWGGPALTKARVTGIVERYGFGDWEQEVKVGDLPEQSLLHTENRPGRGRKSSASRKRKKRKSTGGRKSSRQSWAKREHTHDVMDLASGAVGEAQLADGSVTAAKLATDAVTNAKIATGAVDTAELATDAVTAAKIGAGEVGSSEIAINAVGNSAMQSNAIDTAELATDAVTAAKIEAGAVGQSEIAANSVGNSEMRDNAIDTAELASGAVTEAEIGTGAVTNTKLGTAAVTSTKIGAGEILSGHIGSGEVNAGHIITDGVTPEEIAANAVNTSEIANGAVTYDKLSAALRALLGI